MRDFSFWPCVNEGFVLLGCYASADCYFPTFQDSLSALTSSVKQSLEPWTFERETDRLFPLLDPCRWDQKAIPKRQRCVTCQKREDLKTLDAICCHKIYSNKNKAEIFDCSTTGTLYVLSFRHLTLVWLNISQHSHPPLLVANIFLCCRINLKIYALNTKIENIGTASRGLGTAAQFKFTIFGSY